MKETIHKMTVLNRMVVKKMALKGTLPVLKRMVPKITGVESAYRQNLTEFTLWFVSHV